VSLSRRVLLLCVAALAGAAPVVASTTDVLDLGRQVFRVYTDQDGLPQNSIESMTLAADGKLWVCTRDGAAAFDGSRWRAVNLPVGAASNWPRKVLATRDGALWFATEGGGLHRLAEGHWTSWSLASQTDDTQVTDLLEAVPNAADTRLWVGTRSGLLRLAADGLVSQVQPPSEAPFPEVTALATIIGEDRRAILAVGTARQGVLRYDGEQWSTFGIDGGPASEVRCLRPSSHPLFRLWAGTENGLAAWNGTTWRTWLSSLHGPHHPIVTDIAETLRPDGTLEVWVATEGGGLACLRGEEWSIYRGAAGLPSDFVYSLQPVTVAAGTRTLFVGTMTGLAHLEANAWTVFDRTTGLPADSVVSLLEETNDDGDHTLWFGTAGGGLARLQEGRWTTFDTSDGLPDDAVFSLLASRQNGSAQPTIWAGTNRGLAMFERGRWRPFTLPTSLPNEAVVVLHEAMSESGRPEMWVGTYGGGLVRRVGERFERINSADCQLPDDRIEALLTTTDERNQKTLWIATNRGLVVRTEDGETTVIDHRNGLPNDVVRSLHLTTWNNGSRTLWVGTGRGLAWSDPDTTPRTWAVMDEASQPALPDDVIYRVEEDRRFRLYVTTNRGVVRLWSRRPSPRGPGDLEVTVFGTAHGLPANECNFGASMVDSEGRIWVGTVKGAAVLDPNREVPDESAKPLLLERATVMGRAEALKPNEILSHSENRVSFSFALVAFFRAADARFRSQLVGLETSPGPWFADTHRDYVNLGPGHYVFRVWGRDAAGVVSGPVEFAFDVRPPPWRRWWAWLAYTLLAAAAIATGIRIRVHALRRRTLELQELVALRTRELEHANRALEEMSITDPLTGAHNRRFIDAHLVETLAKHRSNDADPRRAFLFLALDVDHFKSVNDQWGHAVGDRVLVHMVDVIRRSVPQLDCLIRWGGEEFLVVVEITDNDEAPLIAESVRSAVAEAPIAIRGGGSVHVTCSLGFALFPVSGGLSTQLSWDDVVTAADNCLYLAKRNGRNCWVGIVGMQPSEASGFDARLRHQLQQAVAEEEVELVVSRGKVEDLEWA